MHSHIIFDLDGTLIESLPGIANALNIALEKCSLPTHTVEDIRSFIGDGAHTLCQRAAADASESKIEELHTAFMEEYPKAWKTSTLVFEGVRELIAEFSNRGYKLSILSNKPHAFTTEIADYFFPEQPFDLVLGQREGIAKKPDPSGIHEILGELGQSSANSILIGDSSVDVITARNAGISSLAVTWGYENKEQLKAVSPTHTAESIEQLIDILTPKNVPAFRQPA